MHSDICKTCAKLPIYYVAPFVRNYFYFSDEGNKCITISKYLSKKIPMCTISKYFHFIFFCQKLITNWNIKFYHRMEIKDPPPFLRNMV